MALQYADTRYPWNGPHRCNHDHCGKFGRYTLIDGVHGWFVYACKRHRHWAYGLTKSID